MVRPPLLLCLLALALPLPAAAQDGIFATLTTDKEEYAYGETVELTYTIVNETEETFRVWGPTSCVVGFAWGSLVHPGDPPACTADYRPFAIPPATSASWFWRLNPAEHGVPETDGEQTVWAGVEVLFEPESVKTALMVVAATFSAPRYVGGRLAVTLVDGVTLEDVADVIEALNATVVESYMQHHYWEIDGTTVAVAVATYGDDDRFARMEVNRLTHYADRWTSATEGTAPIVAALSTAHPNPFTTAATLTLTPPPPRSGARGSLRRARTAGGRAPRWASPGRRSAPFHARRWGPPRGGLRRPRDRRRVCLQPPRDARALSA